MRFSNYGMSHVLLISDRASFPRVYFKPPVKKIRRIISRIRCFFKRTFCTVTYLIKAGLEAVVVSYLGRIAIVAVFSA